MSDSAPAFPYKLVATDLDGTLLRSDDTVSERTREALAAATAAGAAHIVVTGRAAPWTRHILDELGYDGIAVCAQGAQVYDAGAHRLLTTLTLDRQLAALALAKIEAEVGALALAASRDGLDGDVLIGPGYQVQGLLQAVPFTDLAELWAEPLTKLYIQHPRLTDDELADAARQAAGGLVSITMAGEGIVEILPSVFPRPRASHSRPAVWASRRPRRSRSAICPTTSRCSAGPRTAWPWPTPMRNSKRSPTS